MCVQAQHLRIAVEAIADRVPLVNAGLLAARIIVLLAEASQARDCGAGQVGQDTGDNTLRLTERRRRGARAYADQAQQPERNTGVSQRERTTRIRLRRPGVEFRVSAGALVCPGDPDG